MAEIGELKIGHLVEWIEWSSDVSGAPYFPLPFTFAVRIRQGKLVSFNDFYGVVSVSGWFGDRMVTVPVGKLCHDQEFLRGWLVSRLNGSVSCVVKEGK